MIIPGSPTPPLLIQTSAVTVANSVAETTLLGTVVGSKVIAAGFFYPGKSITILGMGFHSTTANPTLDIKFKVGAVTALDSGAIATANSTNDICEIRGLLTCITSGTSGTFLAQGFWTEGGAGANIFSMVNTAAVTINTTIANTMDLTAQWGTQSASNTITLSNLIIDPKG